MIPTSPAPSASIPTPPHPNIATHLLCVIPTHEKNHLHSRSVPWLLLFVAILTYGLLFNQLGFYWDEFPWYWTSVKLGPAALTQLFSTSRPFWGLIYQVTLPLVGRSRGAGR